MAGHAPPVGLSDQDFDTIEDAVMETARGRWFLREYARRMRAADTNRLLEAMSRLERAVTGQPAGGDGRLDLYATSVEGRALRLGQLAVSLREQGYDGDLCGRIAREAQSLIDLAQDMRGEGTVEVPVTPAASVAEPWSDAADPHAAAPVTIDAQVLAEVSDPAEDLPVEVEDAVPALPDLAALAPLDALPFKDKLALFS